MKTHGKGWPINSQLKTTILIVEDDPGIAELEKDRLTEAGYEILVAGTADEAVTHLRTQRVDLILLDYQFPGAENGLDFYACVKVSGYDVPVILVTGFANETTAILALRAGIRDFVTKSVEYLDYLPDAVSRVLHQVQIEHRMAESEARLGAVIDSAKDAVILAEADRRISLFNPAAEQMFGCPADAAIGRRITDFIPDELAAPPDALGVSEAYTVSHRLRAGTRGVRAGGEEFPLEASVSRGEANGRRFYTVVVRDVTERRRAEQAVRESEKRFRAVFDQAAVGVALVGPDETFIVANPGFCHLLGYAPEEIPALTVAAVSHPDDYPRCVPLLGEVRTRLRDDFSIEKRYVRKDGSSIWGAATVSVVRYPTGQVEYWVVIIQDISSRRQTEERVREQAALLDLAHDGIMMEDMDGLIRFWNRGAERLHGWTADEVLGRPAESLLDSSGANVRSENLRLVLAEGQWTGERRQVTKSGREIIVYCSWSLVRDTTGKPVGVLRICTDMTEQKKVEEQYRQAQKMEVFGRLAAGVAHDFNNLLTVINGYSEIVFERLPASDPAREMVREIGSAGERAAGLTRQLLAFSRQQVLEPKVLNLNEVVQGLTTMLRRLIGEDLHVKTALSPTLGKVKADPGQIEQVLTNLAVNARDAMPRQGRLTIETADVELDAGYARAHPDVSAGRYVMMAVSDTGQGMTEEVMNRIFEPFFTTKGVGKGTGLGLATVFGIVKQSGGHVAVSSEVGRGTTFRVYLPRVEAEPVRADKAAPHLSSRAPPGSETILLVEDEPAVRALALCALQGNGYTVMQAANGEEALRLCRAHEGPIHLLVSDVVMPELGGGELADRVVALRPEIRVLFLSGYTPDAVLRHGVLEADVAFLQKPFTVDGLARKVREVLGG